MSPLACTIVERLRFALSLVDELAPAEQDLVVGALVADLRSRRPVAVAPLGVLPPPTEKIVDPRRAR